MIGEGIRSPRSHWRNHSMNALKTDLSPIKLIQGGMGVYVSNWRLAQAVASARPGQTVGTVSGTALDVVYVRLLQLGDPGGHARRALAALDATHYTDMGRRICDH
jgi:NAD(P)H-dependent flavin oxidoreductase YrpB (nitropropane dioxygenase family)